MFKLILGLGNKDLESAIKIVETYLNTNGTDIIDLSAPVIYKIQNHLKNKNYDLNKVKFCASVALLGDIHNKKAKINKNCTQCEKCIEKCSQKAIEFFENSLRINQDKCVGCAHCKKTCKHNAVDIYEQNSFFEDIELLKNENIKLDMIELHLSIKKRKEILKGFKYILDNFKGDISCCLSRKHLSTLKTVKLIKELKEMFYKQNNNSVFWVQLDGSSVNNGNDEYKSNLEALSFYNEIKEQLPDINFAISGGLNSKTLELCKLFNLKPKCLAFGGWARKLAVNRPELVKDFISDIKGFYK